MSINNFTNKIKKILGVDTFTLVCLFVVIGVGISAFNLGRLSTLKKEPLSDVKIVSVDNLNNDLMASSNSFQIKNYVASKSGKLYYPVNCNLAKKILAKNQIYFETVQQAEQAGFLLASSCK